MLVESDVTCGACGQRKIGFRGTSDNLSPFEYCDLDLRSPMEMLMLVECEGCGACAPHLGDLPANLRPALEAAAFRSLLQDEWPRLRRLSKWAYIADVLDKPHDVVEAIVEMSWLYEGDGMFDEAMNCQRDAARRLSSMRLNIGQIQGIGAQLIAGRRDLQLVDLLRQTSQFDEAILFAEQFLSDPTYKFLHKLLGFEVRLSRARNAERYAVADADSDAIPVKPTRAARATAIFKWKADRELNVRREATSVEDSNRFHRQLLAQPHACDHCGAVGGADDYHLSIGRVGAVICRKCSWPQRVWIE